MNLNLQKIDMSEKLKEWAKNRDEQQLRHVGTHIDIYYNFHLDESLKECRGIVLDVRGVEKIGIQILKNQDIQKGDFVIFRTGYMENFGYASDKYLCPKEAPHLTDELIDNLIEKGVKLIGIDFHCAQLGDNNERIDKYTESKGTYIVENITNLDKISNVLKLKLKWTQSMEDTAIPISIEALI